MGVVGAVAPVTTGATVLASPTASAPAAEVYDKPLPPVAGLLMVTVHSSVAVPVSVNENAAVVLVTAPSVTAVISVQPALTVIAVVALFA
jgi:hypothetical protein